MLFKRVILICFCFLGLSKVSKAQLVVNPGTYQKICPGTKVVLGAHPTATGGVAPYSFVWTPTVSLAYPDSSNPIASPSVTNTYTVSVRDAAGNINPKLDTVTLYVYPYSLSASPVDTTIKEGETITLHAHTSPSQDTGIWWAPVGNMYNPYTFNPNAFPTSTTQYTVVVNFPHSCALYELVKVNVIPSSELVFYNSFTPNGDGANDYFYIGNLSLYPNNTLDIYNRYGQKIYSVTGYNNDWNGTYLGTEVPCGTYFYILDTHDKPGKHKGEVSIIR